MIKILKFQTSSFPLFRIVFLLFFFFSVFTVQAQFTVVKNISLVKLLTKLEKDYQVNFSYDVSLVKDQKIKYLRLPNNLQDILIVLFRDSNLGFEQYDDKNIIIKQVPNNFFEQFDKKICGYIVDASVGMSLGHVSVSIQNTSIGGVADSMGYFVLKGPIVDIDLFQASFIGFNSRLINVSFFLDKPCKTFFMHPKKMEITEVIVREDFNQFAGTKASQVESGLTIIRPELVKGTGGVDPKDVFGTLQLLPGVTSTDESATLLNVRGGSPGQNLVLYDDIPLYSYGHIQGKTSSFNTNMIREIHFSKGGFSAKNAGSVASIIDIKGKNEIPKQAKTKVDLSFLSTGFTVEAPVLPNVAVFFGARKSIFDFSGIHNVLLDQVFQGTRVEENKLSDTLGLAILGLPDNSYYDVFGRAIWLPSNDDNLSLTGLAMGDAVYYEYQACEGDDCLSEKDQMKSSNAGANASWQHFWLPNFYSFLKYSYSGYKKTYDYSNSLTDSLHSFSHNKNIIRDYSLQLNNQWQRNDVLLRFGLQSKRVHGILDNISHERVVKDSLFDDNVGYTTSLFIDYQHDLSDMFHFFIGGRLSRYGLINDKVYLEPRFSVVSSPSKYLTIQMNGGLYVQTMNQLLNPSSLFGHEADWVLAHDLNGSNKELFAVQRSDQLAVGVLYRREYWQWKLDVYDKQVKGVSSRIVGFQQFDNQSVGLLKASGVEFGIQRWTKRNFSVFSYSRSNAWYEFSGLNEAIAAPYHHLNQMSILQGIKYKNFSGTISWKWNSGVPFTEVDKIKVDTISPTHFQYELLTKKINEGRLLAYHRFDISLEYAHQFHWGKGTATLSVINILNRQNILRKNYQLIISDAAILGEADPILREQIRKGLPFLPNLTIGVEFGLKENKEPKK